MRCLIILVCAACLLCLQARFVLAQTDKIDAYVQSEMQRRHLPGLSLVVLHDGQVVKAQGYGLADLQKNIQVSPDTVFQLASGTKPFTATGIMLLVEDGKIGLDDKISDHLKDLPETWNAITIRQLLSHTSGIPSYLRSPNVKWEKPYTPQQIIQLVRDMPLSFPSGQRWEYSNTGYVLLAMIIHEVTGKSYDQFLEDRVFKPLGMTSTYRSKPGDESAGCALGYQWNGKKVVDAEKLNPTLWDNGDGGIMSTGMDLAKFTEALRSDTLLKASTRQQMSAETKLANGNDVRTMFDDGYGLGWFLDCSRGYRLVWHSGGRPRAVSVVSRFVDNRLTVIILANLDGWNPIGMSRVIAGFYDPALATPSMMQREEDSDAQLSQNIREVISDLANGTVDQRLMTAGQCAAITDKGDSEIANLLKTMTTLDYLTTDNVGNRQIHCDGARINRIRYYKAVGGKMPQYLALFLADDGKVALVQRTNE